jgi:transcriptional regulator with XRE-family HTH domain
MGHIQEMGELAKRADCHVGVRIRERRVVMGLTRQDLADAAGVTYQQLAKYETGANRISVGHLYEMARRLEIDVGYFFEGLEPTAASEPMEHEASEISTIEMARDFAGIADPGLRSAVSGLVKALSRQNRR